MRGAWEMCRDFAAIREEVQISPSATFCRIGVDPGSAAGRLLDEADAHAAC
jgi:hypothetical protein